MADLTIADVRAKYPQYKDLSDEQLVTGLHKKYYSDMPLEQFEAKVGYYGGGGGIPDSKPMAPEPAPKGDAGGSFFNKLPGVLNPIARAAVGAGETGLAMATGAAAPFVGIARGEGGRADNATTGYQPQTRYGQEYTRKLGEGMGAVGKAVNVPGLGMAAPGMLGELSALGRSVPAASQAVGDAARAVPPAVGSAVGRAVAPVSNAVGKAADTLRGTPYKTAQEAAKAAQGEALSATRGALGQSSSELGKTAVQAGQEAAQGQSVATAIERNLQQIAERGDRPTLDVQGNNVRTAIQGAYENADAIRSSGTKGLYDEAKKAAAAREKDGARIDVSTVTPEIEALLDKAENIPDLKAKLSKLVNSVTGAPEKPGVAAPLGKGVVSSKIKPTIQPASAKLGLTYEELDLANKYLKDIAYSGEMQGYDAIVRRAALKLSQKLDTQIAAFVPEHAAASAKYAELSKPLESLATRIGKAVAGAEGGIKGDAYSKVAAQNLPQRLFSTKDGIDLVVDAIAGGKDVSPAARKAAQAQVDKMVEHWILENARGATGATGEAAARSLRTPGMQATTQAVPEVAKKLTSQFAGEERMARQGARATESAKAAETRAKAAEGAKARIDKAMEQAEVDYKYGSKVDAYNNYVAALRQAMSDIDPAKYKAAISLIDRAGEAESGALKLKAKTDKARSLAKRFLYGAAILGIGEEVRSTFQ